MKQRQEAGDDAITASPAILLHIVLALPAAARKSLPLLPQLPLQNGSHKKDGLRIHAEPTEHFIIIMVRVILRKMLGMCP